MSNPNPPMFGWRSLDWGVIIALTVQVVALVYWASGIEAKTEKNAENIQELQVQVQQVNSDIRAILIGVEQIKGRLGIIESTKN